MTFEARNALMLAKKVLDKAAEYKKIAEKAEGGATQGRKLNKVGLFSKAAEQAKKLPQAAPAAQLISTLVNRGGVKQEELQNAGLLDQQGKVTPEWASRGKMTPDELAEHLHRELPQVEEKVLGISKLSLKERQRLFELQDANRSLTDQEAKEMQQLQTKWNAEEPTKYDQYTLPGGENYREVLLKLPDQRLASNEAAELSEMHKREPLGQIRRDEIKRYQELIDKERDAPPAFQSDHWKDDPNVLAHIRMSDRTGPNGEKILHVEEVQSDWGQKGKKEGFRGEPIQYGNRIEGYIPQGHSWTKTTRPDKSYVIHQLLDSSGKVVGEGSDKIEALKNSGLNPSVPSAPYVTSTPGWTDLALKRILKEAAEGGYDKVVWTPGDEQAKRYDLSKQIDSVKYSPAYTNPETGNSFSGKLTAYKNGSAVINRDVMSRDEVKDLIGKELADKLIQSEQKKGEKDFRPYHYLEGEDLSVGGEGMKGYYDNILPKRLQAIAQKHDKTAKVGYTDVLLPPSGKRGSNNPPMQAPGLTITPQMRDSILKGQEGFARGGEAVRTPKVHKPHTPVTGEKSHGSKHPAMMIPGIHVVEGIHGIPYFTGKK